MASERMTVGFSARSQAVCGLVLGVALLCAPSSAMSQTGTVTGTVTNAVTAAPVTGGSVLFCTPDTTTCATFPLNAAGNYAATLAAGTYVAFTATPAALVDEIFDNIPCPLDCDQFSARDLGTPIVVASGSTLSGRNFALSPAGAITGRVTNAATGAPLANVQVEVSRRFGQNLSRAEVTSDASGVFTVTTLAPGTYFASTRSVSAASTHTNMIFGNILCVRSCNDAIALVSGTPIVVTAGATTGGIDFALAPGGAISGRVLNSATSAPLRDVTVSVWTRTGVDLTAVKSVTTGASGAYAFAGLHPGVYLVSSDAYRASAVSEVHANKPCRARCSLDEVGGGTPVTVTASTTSTIDFSLDPGGSISGSIAAAGTLTPVLGVVDVYRLSGAGVRLAARASTTSSGAFVVSGLSTGSYVALVQVGGYASTLYNGLLCEPCSSVRIAAGTPIAVTNGANTPGINFTLGLTATIRGTVRAAATNAPVVGARMLVFRAGSPTAVALTFTNTAGGYTVTGLAGGTYFVATDAAQLTNQVYSGVVCPGSVCTASVATSQGSPIPVSAGATVTGFDFSLGPPAGPPNAPLNLRAAQSPAGVQFTWEAPRGGGAPTGYVLEAGLTAGSTFATVPVATTTFTVPGVPAGTYFIRVRGTNAAGVGPVSDELTLRVGAGGVVLPGPPTGLETTVVTGRLTMTWFPPSEGPEPSGYLVEVGSAAGLANLAVLPVAGRAFVFDGVPPGFYFMRVRAQNAGGTSLPTDDQLVVAGNVAAPPSAPDPLGPTIAGNVVTLNWQPPAFGPVTRYVIEVGSAPGLSNLGVLDTGSSATSLVIPGVPRGTYYLRLRAVNGLGASGLSEEQVLVVP